MTSVAFKRDYVTLFWAVLSATYLVGLWLTSLAGPLWAFWIWSAMALPAFAAAGWRRAARVSQAAWISSVWLVLLVMPFALRRPWLPELTEAFLTVLVVVWPLIVAWKVVQLRRLLVPA